MKKLILLLMLGMLGLKSFSQDPVLQKIKAQVDKVLPQYETMYMDLHQSPELSFQEFKTSDKMAAHLESLGFEGPMDPGIPPA